MSRLNIEDSLFVYDKFVNLCVLLNSDIKAIGWWVKVARLAQTFWMDDKKLIPENVYKWNKFHTALIDSGIVEKQENGYYLKGSEENFAWIYAKALGGRSSHGGGRPLKSLEIKTAEKQQKTTEKQPPSPSPSPSPSQIHNILSDSFLDDFNALWENYPKKDGKKISLKHFNASVKNVGDVEKIKLALNNYKKSIENKKTESRFIKNGSTFFNNWNDWVNPTEEMMGKNFDYDRAEIDKIFMEAKNGQ